MQVLSIELGVLFQFGLLERLGDRLVIGVVPVSLLVEGACLDTQITI